MDEDEVEKMNSHFHVASYLCPIIPSISIYPPSLYLSSSTRSSKSTLITVPMPKKNMEKGKRTKKTRRESRLTALQIDALAGDERPEVAVWDAVFRVVHDAVGGVGVAVAEEFALAGRLEELAAGAGVPERVVAGHVPGEDAELGEAAGVEAGGVDGDVDGLAVVAVGVAGVGAVEEELAGGVVGEEGREDVAVVAVHVAEVVEAEGGIVAAAEPPGVADVLLVVALACGGEVKGRVRRGTVKGEGLRVAVQTDDAVDVVAGEGLRYEVGVEGVEEVVGLVGEGWSRGGEVTLASEGEEHGGVVHDVDEGLVQTVLHHLDDAGHLSGQLGHLYHLRRYRIDREDPPPDLRRGEQGILNHLCESDPSIG